ncbi:hypothetical protein BDW59DRAFT_166798 [Aspergillus cavernicola]|uniref:Uncharacterized protein n=1 Tax=Aspergillus cavernicola TaxID=176166 RepID=A0ABR4HIT5_9EURO
MDSHQIPAGEPPPGVEPNFVDPPKQLEFIIMEGIFTPPMLMAVILRVYVQTRMLKLRGPEDTTCILAACGSLANMAMYMKLVPETALIHHVNGGNAFIEDELKDLEIVWQFSHCCVVWELALFGGTTAIEEELDDRERCVSDCERQGSPVIAALFIGVYAMIQEPGNQGFTIECATVSWYSFRLG